MPTYKILSDLTVNGTITPILANDTAKGIDITLSPTPSVYQNGIRVSIPYQSFGSYSGDLFRAELNGQAATVNGSLTAFVANITGQDNISFLSTHNTYTTLSTHIILQNDSNCTSKFISAKVIGAANDIFSVDYAGNVTGTNFIGNASTATKAQANTFFTTANGSAEHEIGCESFVDGTTTVPRSYLYSNKSGWGLYDSSNVSLIAFNRITKKVTVNYNEIVVADGNTYNLKSTGVNATLTPSTDIDLVLASQSAGNDYFRIRVGGSYDALYAEIATADNGNEPIYVRQYISGFDIIARQATLLDGQGNTSFPGIISCGSISAISTIIAGLSIISNGNIKSTGDITSTANMYAVGFYNTSDIRLKKVIKKDYNVSDIKAISYKWKDESKGDKIQIGYSAQEVQKYIPDAIIEDSEGMLSINYISVLVAKIDALEKRITQLENKCG